jgi:putative transposase
MKIAEQEAPRLGVSETCQSLGLSRATYYRRRKKGSQAELRVKRRSPRKLKVEEEKRVLSSLTSERFMDRSVPEVHATLLDEGAYLCSVRTMYRILEKYRAVRERRNQRRHPQYRKPELLATGPNQVWSWDITKLKGPRKWSHYHLYVIMDIYSRYVVGWMVAERESAMLAERLIRETCERQGIVKDQLTIHADRGVSMRSKTVAQLMADLGVTRSHSRPHVCDDNPYSESQFKTLKYHPSFPGQFGSLEDARLFLRHFFYWYNDEHRHSGVAMMTPKDVHIGKADEIIRKRQETMNRAYSLHPERFVKGQPKLKPLSREVWINKPKAA